MITAEGLTKRFDDFEAVRGVSLEVREGELLALLGPNGAGKTTTVRMLSAILRPTAGRATVMGYDVVAEADRVRRSIGLLTEQPGLYPRMSGLEYLVFYGRLYGLDDEVTARRSRELFARFAMADAADRRLGTYSKGMRQKVGIIRAMLHEPSVLLLDEPTSAMDPRSAKIVRDAVAQLRRDQRSIIVCTHNLAEAEALADRIAIINAGRIVAHGTVAELKQALLGAPLMQLQLDRSLNGETQFLDELVTVEMVDGRVIRYRTAEPDRHNPELVHRLSALGLGVVSLQALPQSLEDVYLRVVGAVPAEGDEQ
ncbi:MAG: ABC transporter ATP-binding protein [Anaerolineae bacterium]|nr:ABC transporter ATP-binding protein [Anaerolineae bacterium]